MKIEKIYIEGYRNLKKYSTEFDPKINFIYGENAQGKTNLIEAIWMFTGARSFRGTKDADLVNFEKDSAKIKGDFFFENRNQEIAVFFDKSKRKIFLNNVAKPYPTGIIGKFRVVLFSPIQLSIIRGGPDFRRRFIDSAICKIYPGFMKTIVKYNQTLRQRNAYLKTLNVSKSSEHLLDIWDEKLSDIGAELVKKRLDYLVLLKEELFKIYGEISNKNEFIEAEYVSGFFKNLKVESSFEEIKNEMKTKLEKFRKSDIKTGFTAFGPHKDELEISIDRKNAKKFASQGQQRSLAVCLKLAEAAVMENIFNEPPVIILDDVMSELDDNRKNYIQYEQQTKRKGGSQWLRIGWVARLLSSRRWAQATIRMRIGSGRIIMPQSRRLRNGFANWSGLRAGYWSLLVARVT